MFLSIPSYVAASFLGEGQLFLRFIYSDFSPDLNQCSPSTPSLLPKYQGRCPMASWKIGPPTSAVCLAAGLLLRRPWGCLCSRSPHLCEGSQLPPPTLTRLSFVPTEENEERTVIDPTSRDDPRFKELVKVRVSLPVGLSCEGKTLGSGSSGSKE